VGHVILRPIRIIWALIDVGMLAAQDNIRERHRVREFIPAAPPQDRTQRLVRPCIRLSPAMDVILHRRAG